MKLKIAMIAIILLIVSKITAQNVSVEKSIYGIQTGLLGIWVHNESRLSNEFVFRTELGFDGGYRYSDFYDLNYYVLAPVITAEPRWYYNLEKRNKKGKNTTKNSANFVGLKLSFHPDWFTISNEDNISITNQISFIPKWGIKRTLGDHFTYETGIGLGYEYYFYKNEGYPENEGGIAVDLHVRIGYSF